MPQCVFQIRAISRIALCVARMQSAALNVLLNTCFTIQHKTSVWMFATCPIVETASLLEPLLDNAIFVILVTALTIIQNSASSVKLQTVYRPTFLLMFNIVGPAWKTITQTPNHWIAWFTVLTTIANNAISTPFMLAQSVSMGTLCTSLEAPSSVATFFPPSKDVILSP